MEKLRADGAWPPSNPIEWNALRLSRRFVSAAKKVSPELTYKPAFLD
jgi:hypothetical protein